MLHERKTLLLFSPDAAHLGELHGWLKEKYQTIPLRQSKEIIQFLEQKPAHLLMLDAAAMGGENPATIVDTIRSMAQNDHLPVILLTDPQMPDLPQLLQDNRYSDVLLIPLRKEMVLRSVTQQLELSELRWRSDMLVEEATVNLVKERDLLIWLFSNLAEYRDQEQGSHILRTQACVHKLITGYNDLFPERAIDSYTAHLIVLSSQLHDIGKIATPDSVLLKPGRLTPEEFDIMKRHTVQGNRALQNPYAGETPPFLLIAQQIAMSHHEKWDGTGYPQGLRGEQIPLPARIVSVVDVLDALMSLRPYRQPLTFEQATQSIVEGRGTHFDPDLVDAFLSQAPQIREIYMGYQDG